MLSIFFYYAPVSRNIRTLSGSILAVPCTVNFIFRNLPSFIILLTVGSDTPNRSATSNLVSGFSNFGDSFLVVFVSHDLMAEIREPLSISF